jgi:hypothetical protein
MMLTFTEEEWKRLEEIAENRKDYYEIFYISKKRKGKKRQINAPNDELKKIQERILYEFLYKHFVPSVYATGFIKKRSIVDNAAAHVGSKIIVKIDLKDFFPSIKSDKIIEPIFYKKRIEVAERVRRKKLAEKQEKNEWTIKEEDYKLSDYMKKKHMEQAKLLTKIVTYPYDTKEGVVDGLPQGAPTSPAISNIVCFEMDNVLAGFAKRNDAVYTRYADDLAFSSGTNKKLNRTVPIIEELVTKYGFTVNKNKIRVNRQSPYRRMSVTGLVVNDKVSYGRGRYRIIRAALHNRKMMIKDGQIPPFNELHWRGKASFIQMFDKKKADFINKECDEIREGIKRLKEEQKKHGKK